jgi:hypothetical protein
MALVHEGLSAVAEAQTSHRLNGNVTKESDALRRWDDFLVCNE